MENYGTVEGADTYHAARGNMAWAVLDASVKAQALLIASEWLDASYLTMFAGWKVGGREQVREWPRIGVIDVYGHSIAYNSVPREIEHATYEAALREGAARGTLVKDWTPNKYKSVSVDGAVSVTFADAVSAADIQMQFPIIRMLLLPLLARSAHVSNGLVGMSYRI